MVGESELQSHVSRFCAINFALDSRKRKVSKKLTIWLGNSDSPTPGKLDHTLTNILVFKECSYRNEIIKT